MNSIFLGIKYLIWPSVVLIIAGALVYIISIYLLDLNKISASTNRANCQIQMAKDQIDQPTICKDIFDSARR